MSAITPETVKLIADAINDKTNTFDDIVNIILKDPYCWNMSRIDAELFLYRLLTKIYGLMENSDH